MAAHPPLEFVDADAHVIEGPVLGAECRRRWPETSCLGADFILYASDYPQWDGEWPESTRPLRERRDISDDVRAKIAGANARRLYGLGPCP